VLVDGVDVREMTQADLRSRIGFVPQKAVLFTGTVAANIRYGRENATDEEVQRAAAVAQAIDFIDAMPDKFAAPISQGGINLSGGQKQRLSIARAIVRKPDVYVFDDSFSALDFATDAKLRAALRDETGDATVFVVAQRISTVINADRIIVLENGEWPASARTPNCSRPTRSTAKSWRRKSRSRRSHEHALATRRRSAAASPQEPPRTAPPRDMFGGRPIGGIGMPTQKAKDFKGRSIVCSAICVRIERDCSSFCSPARSARSSAYWAPKSSAWRRHGCSKASSRRRGASLAPVSTSTTSDASCSG
jgi:ABC-type proline/glycine betaine transport system ATPase subunit